MIVYSIFVKDENNPYVKTNFTMEHNGRDIDIKVQSSIEEGEEQLELNNS